MKPWHGSTIVALLVLLVAVGVAPLLRSPSPVQWKYKVEKMGSDAALDGMGRQGWEIVSARWIGDDYELIYRKPS